MLSRLSQEERNSAITNSSKVLVFARDKKASKSICCKLRKNGVAAIDAHDRQTAENLIQTQTLDAVLLKTHGPTKERLETLKHILTSNGYLPVIVLASSGSVKEAVGMIKAGAYDYLAGQSGSRKLMPVLRSALNGGSAKTPVNLKEVSSGHLSLQEVMGNSRKIQDLASEVRRVADTGYSVLIAGETGVGKELVARALHAGSLRSSGRFVAVDCGAIQETLIESELFGYEKGAFTGANRTKTGKFEVAAKGTLFLDEISNLPLAMQTNLLRVLQERKFYRVGGNTAIRADVRIVAATNQDMVSHNGSPTFRSDLYYRLAEYIIHVPPLRERREDIIFLARRFVEMTCAELGKNVRHISEDAQEMLLSHDWPGNVRELRNIIRRAVLLTDNGISPQHLQQLKMTEIMTPGTCNTYVNPEPAAEPDDLGRHSLTELVRRNRIAFERKILARMLEQAGGNKAEVARMLRVDYKTVHTKLKQLGISTPRKKKKDKL